VKQFILYLIILLTLSGCFPKPIQTKYYTNIILNVVDENGENRQAYYIKQCFDTKELKFYNVSIDTHIVWIPRKEE
jgi:hypothetical protein